MPELTATDAASFARLAKELQGEPTASMTLQKIVDLAIATIPGCDYAGVTTLHPDRLEGSASTDPLVDGLNEDQHRLGQGPCLDTARTEVSHVVQDTSSDPRWPAWMERAAAAGVNSVISVLIAPKPMVALNLYSKTVDAYDSDAVTAAEIFGIHASNAMTANRQADGLNIAMRTRHQIGMAQGMLMLRYGLTEAQAFQFLTRTSQDENLKLREVAARVADELGGTRWPEQTG